MTRVAAIVGNELRHRWLASRLAADDRLELVGVAREYKRAQPAGATHCDEELIREHFASRGEAEQRFFAAVTFPRALSRSTA